MSRTGEYQKITIFFAGLAFLSMVGYTVLTDTTPLYFLMTCMLCEGFSLGVALTTTLIAMLSCVETKGKIPSYFGRKSSGDANIVKKIWRQLRPCPIFSDLLVVSLAFQPLQPFSKPWLRVS